MSKTRKKVNNNICMKCSWRKTHGTGKLCSICKRFVNKVIRKTDSHVKYNNQYL